MNDDAETTVVIERGWTPEQILSALREWTDDPIGSYVLDVYRFHTKAQDEAEGACGDYDTCWSPDGWGRTSIDVAVAEMDIRGNQ